MGRACSKHGKEKECIYGFGEKARRKENTRNIILILRWVLEKWDGVSWTG
jgi:hypothetical protein